MTNVGALGPGCTGPGPGVRIDKGNDAFDVFTIVNSIFWDNGDGLDFAPSCGTSCDRVDIRVSYSLAQQNYTDLGLPIVFGDGMMEPVDPLFASPEDGDFHLRSTAGHWTPDGYATDAETSPAIGAGDPAGSVDFNPADAGDRTELGAYGNTPEASLLR